MSHWIAHYGVLGVFLSAMIEGELGVLVGGALAHVGRLSVIAVVLAAWIAAFISAEAFFYAGRSLRDGKWVQKVTERRAFAAAIKSIDRHPMLFCLFYRFIYGMRIVGPVAISLSHIEARTFLIFNAVTAFLWAIAGVALGWLFGPELAHLVRAWFTPQRFAITSIVAAVLLVIVLAWRTNRVAGERLKQGLR